MSGRIQGRWKCACEWQSGNLLCTSLNTLSVTDPIYAELYRKISSSDMYRMKSEQHSGRSDSRYAFSTLKAAIRTICAFVDTLFLLLVVLTRKKSWLESNIKTTGSVAYFGVLWQLISHDITLSNDTDHLYGLLLIYDVEKIVPTSDGTAVERLLHTDERAVEEFGKLSSGEDELVPCRRKVGPDRMGHNEEIFHQKYL
ncbi:hypothetical protein M514_04648 [Trichuris suis]|uniref:Uncharacterized protein n=1 Tax=Trichuris suis TaxID=68888 RepID=A0A085MBA5_9BILA|nr:hypothetical protein M513_04648 [Trichuris suis]KFD73366.1 hypothetical protein M514_04648 [Trichuris suis]